VVRCADEAAKRREVLLRVAASAKPGLLYTATRKDAEAYAGELADLGLAARAYHAGLPTAERRTVHEAFLAGELDVVAATSAFGMGIDKPDLRFVVHASVTDSLDSYYQEVGRAGRDGEPALAVVFYRAEDLGLQRFLTTSSPDPALLEHVAGLVRARGPVTGRELREHLGLSAAKTTGAANLLEQAGALQAGGGELAWVGGRSVPEAVEAAVEVAEARRRMDRSRLEMLRGYAETTTCRRQFLLGYFGEIHDHPCGNCDVCTDGVVDAADPGSAAGAPADGAAVDGVDGDSAWPVNTRVVHRTWGPGIVMRPEGDRITVLFEQQGYKTLALRAVEEHDLLERTG
jgi:ATP-dependent DNA helicase RecQ